MRHLFIIFFLLCSIQSVWSQGEKLYNLRTNPALQQKADNLQRAPKGENSRTQHHHVRAIQQPNTLSMPFRDDFSTNQMPSLDYWENFGIEGYWTSTCRPDSVFADTVHYSLTDTAWQYSYDAGTNSVDSVPMEQIALVFYEDNNDCSTLKNIEYGWPSYYRYTFDNNGARIDSQFVKQDDTLYGDPAIVGQNDPSSLYLDHYAFQNNNYPVDQPTYGVATLNGLNAYGRPHNWLGGANFGPADTLTSKPIDLNGFNSGSDIYFSFYWQPKGLGDYPNENDSIFLEFKDAFGEWQTIWKRGGYESDIANPSFHYEVFALDQPVYFHDDFQFRFRNYASIMGNNDHWHIDYILMNSNRTPDSTVRDYAIKKPTTDLLKEFEAMPWPHFKNSQAQELSDNVSFIFRNLNNVTFNLPFSYNVIDGFTQNVLYKGVDNDGDLFNFNLPPQQEQSLFQLSNIDIDKTSNYTPFSNSLAQGDSALITMESLLQTSDALQTNDTVRRDYKFYNYYAYDDGSAEKAYGVEGPGTKKIAYEFILRKTDTLRAFRVHFTQIDNDASDLQFNLFVWKSLGPSVSGTPEDTLTYMPINGVKYAFKENGFITYRLEEPLVISDTFYVGIAQTSQENIQIGYDRNNDVKEHIYFYSSQSWKSSLFEGALMIRPIVGKDVRLPTSVKAEQEITVQQPVFDLYPNPASRNTRIDIPERGDYSLSIYDNAGTLHKELLISRSRRLKIDDLPPGVYYVQLQDTKSGTSRVKKLVKIGR